MYDFGGSTLNVSIIDAEDVMFEELSSASNTHLGGVDFNQRIIDHFVRLSRIIIP